MLRTDSPGENPGPPRPLGGLRKFLGHRFVYLVLSQRAKGLSIGVNMNPNRHCNFNCPYCEVNRDEPPLDIAVDLPVMAAELKNMLQGVHDPEFLHRAGFGHLPHEWLQLKEVALSGDGEPTLSPQFLDLVTETVAVRLQTSFFKIVLLTNTTGVLIPQVKRALRLLTSQDEIWAKLDAGTQEYMDAVNRPDITLQQVTDNILAIATRRPVIIQSLFPLLAGQEPSHHEILQYTFRLRDLVQRGAKIAKVQIYSAHRPPHREGCGHLPLRALSSIARAVRNTTGLDAEVY